MNFTNFAPGEPKGVETGFYCVEMTSTNSFRYPGAWADHNCSAPLDYICQKPAGRSISQKMCTRELSVPFTLSTWPCNAVIDMSYYHNAFFLFFFFLFLFLQLVYFFKKKKKKTELRIILRISSFVSFFVYYPFHDIVFTSFLTFDSEYKISLTTLERIFRSMQHS